MFLMALSIPICPEEKSFCASTETIATLSRGITLRYSFSEQDISNTINVANTIRDNTFIIRQSHLNIKSLLKLYDETNEPSSQQKVQQFPFVNDKDQVTPERNHVPLPVSPHQ